MNELNKRFAKNQLEREDCGRSNCPAPKATTISTEQGIPIAVCLYHEIKFWPEEERDNRARELTGRDWQTVQQAYDEVVGE